MERVQEFDVGAEPSEVVARREEFANLTGLEFNVPFHRPPGGPISFRTGRIKALLSIGLVELEVADASGGRSRVCAKWRYTPLFPFERAFWEQLTRQFEAALTTGAFDVWAVDRARRRSLIAGSIVAYVATTALFFAPFGLFHWWIYPVGLLLALWTMRWMVMQARH